MKPLWLLDVDGVLNALDPHSNRHNAPNKVDEVYTGWSLIKSGEAKGYHIQWAPELVNRINALHGNDLVEIRWCTTWEHNANDYISPLLRLPEFEVERSGAHRQSWWWKFEIAKLVAEERPLIWTDDDLSAPGDWHEWSAQRKNLLAIAPDYRLGLQPNHMTDIEAFCLEHATIPEAKEALGESSS